MIRNLLSLVLPIGILLLSWRMLLRVPQWSAVHQELLVLAPYFFAVVAFASAYHFKRGRVCLLVVLSTLGYYLGVNSFEAAGTPQAWMAYRALAVVIPFNLLLIACMREKGISGVSGRMRLLFLGGQLFVVWLLLRQHHVFLWDFFTRPLFRVSIGADLPLPQLSLLFLLLTATVLLVRVWQQPAPIEGALFGVTIALGIILSWPFMPFVTMIFSSAASLILVFAIIQDSHNMAFRDDLTGLPSRRALNELLRGIGNRYAIAMVDVDHFKRFNDAYGHDVGDQVLKMVAGKLLGVTGGGRSFRYGGEEFTVVFSGKGAKEAVPHLERLRQSIADYKMALRAGNRPKDDGRGQSRRSDHQDGREVSVTVSIGVAESGERYTTVEDVLKAADAALYRAKNGGRNLVCTAGQRS